MTCNIQQVEICETGSVCNKKHTSSEFLHTGLTKFNAQREKLSLENPNIQREFYNREFRSYRDPVPITFLLWSQDRFWSEACKSLTVQCFIYCRVQMGVVKKTGLKFQNVSFWEKFSGIYLCEWKIVTYLAMKDVSKTIRPPSIAGIAVTDFSGSMHKRSAQIVSPSVENTRSLGVEEDWTHKNEKAVSDNKCAGSTTRHQGHQT